MRQHRTISTPCIYNNKTELRSELVQNHNSVAVLISSADESPTDNLRNLVLDLLGETLPEFWAPWFFIVFPHPLVILSHP